VAASAILVMAQNTGSTFTSVNISAQWTNQADPRVGRSDNLLVPRSLAQLATVEESKGKHHVADHLFNEARQMSQGPSSQRRPHTRKAQ